MKEVEHVVINPLHPSFQSRKPEAKTSTLRIRQRKPLKLLKKGTEQYATINLVSRLSPSQHCGLAKSFVQSQPEVGA